MEKFNSNTELITEISTLPAWAMIAAKNRMIDAEHKSPFGEARMARFENFLRDFCGDKTFGQLLSKLAEAQNLPLDASPLA